MTHSEIENCIINGSAPIFSYPTVLYEVPQEPFRVLTKSVISKNLNRVTVP